MFRVAIVGLGLIGRQRLAAVDRLRAGGLDVEVVGTMDPQAEGPHACASIDEVISRQPDLVVLSTPHDVSLELLRVLLPAGVTVLAEKPIGRSFSEFAEISALVQFEGQISVGLNYQYFAGIEAICSDVVSGAFGEGIRLSIEMGHGGSPGDAQTWKLDPVRAGGGALIDPGIHLFDLANVLSGDQCDVAACQTSSRFWKTGIEEDAVAVMFTPDIPCVLLQVSVTQWRSRFRVEFIGTEGYGIVEGRGRSYGQQVYVRGRRWGFLEGGSQRDSEEQVLRSDCEDSFVREMFDVISGDPSSMAMNSFKRMGDALRLVDECRDLAGVKKEF